MNSGRAIFIYGPAGNGKTTIAEGVEFELHRTYGALTYLLDGDRLRTGLNRDLGFSEEARRENCGGMSLHPRLRRSRADACP